MSVETSPEPLNKHNILKAFGGRILMEGREKVERESLDLDSDLTKQSLVSSDIADQYENISIDQGITADPEYKERKEKPLFVKSLKDGTNPISLLITKQMYETEGESPNFLLTVTKGNLEKESDQNIIKAAHDRKNLIGEFIVYGKGNTFNIPHRFVREDYRGPQNKSNERISNIMLVACEQIAKSSANKDSQPKTVEVDVDVEASQIDVMLWLNANGYSPKTPEDQNRFDEICNADEKLCVSDDLYIFPISVPEEQRNYQNRDKAYNIVFEKTLSPGSQKDLLKRIRRRIKNI